MTKPPSWAQTSDEDLLDLRLSDLGLQIEGSFLEPRIEQLYRELRERGICFRPHFWLSDDWFTPDGVTGSALAFYMAHPRLMAMEEKQMMEAEGGTHDWCMRILRHEAGHAIDNAYRLRRKKIRQRLFGKSSEPYPDYYSAKPYSRDYVRHLDSGYAQSHPDEDFAETVAVWLAPGSNWRRRYSAWPVRKKLEYVDELMNEVASTEPLVTNRDTPGALSSIQKTLEEYYREKRSLHQIDFPKTFDAQLRRIFGGRIGSHEGSRAASFLSRARKELRRRVATNTGVYQYTVDRVLEDILDRCRELDLRVSNPPAEVEDELVSLLTTVTLEHLRQRRYRFAL
jgi:hypothetical protein